jgi:hypothetical protein
VGDAEGAEDGAFSGGGSSGKPHAFVQTTRPWTRIEPSTE